MHNEEMTPESDLERHGIRPTAVRILVWKMARCQRNTFTLTDMEDMMPHMDRSSIFRALRLFAENRLLHEIDDGSGSQKYCVCHCEGEKHLNHLHFTCRKCGRTYCLKDSSVPMVDLPDGFVMDEAEYVVKGICPRCVN